MSLETLLEAAEFLESRGQGGLHVVFLAHGSQIAVLIDTLSVSFFTFTIMIVGLLLFKIITCVGSLISLFSKRKILDPEANA